MIKRLTQFFSRRPRQRDRVEGVEYMRSTASVFSAPTITANTIRDLETNAYYVKLRTNQRNLIFSDIAEITVKNEDGEIDDDLSAAIKQMAAGPDVRLNVRMRQAWGDIFDYGAGFLNNVWGWRGNEYRLLQMRYLPAYTFASEPGGSSYIAQGDILRGVVLNQGGDLEYWQRQEDYATPIQVGNVVMIKDPEVHDIAGRPLALPAIYLINLLKFAWKAQMQKVNRVGSPPLFARVTEEKQRPAGVSNDFTYLNKVLQNWGSNVAFQLRENMEFLDAHLEDDQCALDTIQHLEGLLDRYGSPSSLIAKDGTLIGGSNAGELELMHSYIAGIHRWLEAEFEAVLQHYLDVNQFDGYTVEITLPLPSIDQSAIEMQQAIAAYDKEAGTLDEIRGLLHLPPATKEIRAEIEASRLSRQPASPFGMKAPQPTPEAVEEDEADDLEKATEDAFKAVLKALEDEPAPTPGDGPE